MAGLVSVRQGVKHYCVVEKLIFSHWLCRKENLQKKKLTNSLIIFHVSHHVIVADVFTRGVAKLSHPTSSRCVGTGAIEQAMMHLKANAMKML